MDSLMEANSPTALILTYQTLTRTGSMTDRKSMFPALIPILPTLIRMDSVTVKKLTGTRPLIPNWQTLTRTDSGTSKNSKHIKRNRQRTILMMTVMRTASKYHPVLILITKTVFRASRPSMTCSLVNLWQVIVRLSLTLTMTALTGLNFGILRILKSR